MTTIVPYISPELPIDETLQIKDILRQLDWTTERANRIQAKAQTLIETIRSTKADQSEIESFLQNYPLSSPEGRALMTLAEALLRIPDAATADALIAEKLSVSDWKKIEGSSLFAKLTGTGLSLAKSMLGGLLGGISRPVIRKATEETVRQLGGQFVVGETIESALKVAEKSANKPYRMSFDMLGEGARTEEDAERYFKSYMTAATIIGAQVDKKLPLERRHGMSVKLSALHPRYSWTQAEDCIPVITERLLKICEIAASAGFTLTVDAEESDRLEISLSIIAKVAADPRIKGWTGFGLAVQSYDRRAHSVIDYICDLARTTGQRLQIRLVKGAYWDSEIKRAQMAGWPHYAVYTRKTFTDLSYLYAAQKMLAARDIITPMFATHNATTAAAILDFAGDNKSGFEFQRLFGMGQQLGHILQSVEAIPVTFYAPVGSYQDLLPYLVRRMLENGANTSFVSQIRDTDIPVGQLTRDVIEAAKIYADKPSPLPLPLNLYGDHRQNSKGYDLSRATVFRNLNQSLEAVSRLNLPTPPSSTFQIAQHGYSIWNKTESDKRADILLKAADELELNSAALIKCLQSEGKKTLFDAIAELREAVDFCRYYAKEGHSVFAPQKMTGPTGETNTLRLTGRGVFVAISPWNFPLAIFLGQITAALMAGNAVIAKPAEQTPEIAKLAVSLLHKAGIPQETLQLAIGDGRVGAELVAHQSTAGVVFTGSTEVARIINRTLAAKDGPIVPLIAETGGQNAMIVDSTALPEQVVDDILLSAFGSAGQRCSALRVLFVQNEIADKIISLLKGAIPLLKVGNQHLISTDIGPVIDEEALDKLKGHRRYLDSFAKLIANAKLPKDIANETFFAPCAYEIDSLKRLDSEVFGPVLHVIRYAADDLEAVIKEINETGYGLTFGIHSRLASRHDLLSTQIKAGNIYINRNMIGAVVGVQPFGGQGLSGTGPKAGGPHYLARFATEVTIADNIMATGGNIELLASLED